MTAPPPPSAAPTPAPATAQPRSRLRRWGMWALELAVFVGVLLAVRAYMAPAVPVAFTEAAIPAIRAPLIIDGSSAVGSSGELVSLSDPKQPTLLVFWASWCGVCHVELPWIADLARSHRILAIALDSGDAATVATHLKHAGLTDLPVVNDPNGDLARQFGVSVTPTLLFLAPGGRVVTAETGLTSPWGIRLRMAYAGWQRQ